MRSVDGVRLRMKERRDKEEREREDEGLKGGFDSLERG